MDVNYEFWIAYVMARQPATVLDFGCGNGEVVSELRRRGIDCYGTDTFYEGMAFEEHGPLAELLQQDIVRRSPPAGPLGFPDDSFDLIISNMVLEHVVDLEAVTREMDRVLKPGGVMRHHFPTREVLVEGHIGIPFSHRLAPARARTRYTKALRSLGIGTDGAHSSGDETPGEWTARSLDWVDRYCFYRPYGEVKRVFGAFAIRAAEADYCRFRAKRWQRPLLSLLGPLQGVALRRLAFAAFEMRRP